jgi:hypothetical protein
LVNIHLPFLLDSSVPACYVVADQCPGNQPHGTADNGSYRRVPGGAADKRTGPGS